MVTKGKHDVIDVKATCKPPVQMLTFQTIENLKRDTGQHSQVLQCLRQLICTQIETLPKKTVDNGLEGLCNGFVMCMQIQGKILSWSIILAKWPDLASVEVLAMIPGDAVCNGSNGYDLRSWGGFKWISFQRGMQQLHCPI